MSNLIARDFKSVFTIDNSKLSRLLSVIDERFKGVSENAITFFEVATKKGKNFKTSNIDEILKHDNSVNNPIMHLSVVYQDKREEPENWCRIFYDKGESEISVKIKATDPRKGNDLFAEVEEQIERSLVKNWVYSLKRQGPTELMTIIVFPLMLLLLFMAPSNENIKKTDYLTVSDIEYLSQINTNTESEKSKIDYIYEYQSRRIKNITAKKAPFTALFSKGKILNTKFLTIALPFLIVLGGMYYIIWRTYIGSVFLWGDFEEYYNTLLERRKFLWNAVVVSLIIGVVANLFVFGFSQYL